MFWSTAVQMRGECLWKLLLLLRYGRAPDLTEQRGGRYPLLEDLSRTLTPKADFEANHKTQTINLNLVRKWYWLDVNGIVGYDGTLKHKTDGNQLAADGVGCYLDIHVSVDEKNSWSEWFSYKNGDDTGVLSRMERTLKLASTTPSRATSTIQTKKET